MKKQLFAMALLVIGTLALNAQKMEKSAEMTFASETFDYGEVKQGSNGDCEFKFTNTGTDVLILSDVKGSCTCTVPAWPKQPIKPGETGIIKVHYDTKRVGPINKTVTITANIEGNTKVLRIKGNVLATETVGAPVNQTVIPKN